VYNRDQVAGNAAGITLFILGVLIAVFVLLKAAEII
jgi:hypothetical protein